MNEMEKVILLNTLGSLASYMRAKLDNPPDGHQRSAMVSVAEYEIEAIEKAAEIVRGTTEKGA